MPLFNGVGRFENAINALRVANIQEKPYICRMEELYASSLEKMLAGFPPVSKEQWLAQVTKDLKGRSIQDLYPASTEGLRVDPFAHADDFPQLPTPLAQQDNSWEICENILVQNPAQANAQALEALEGGAEGLCFELATPLSGAGLATLLEGIYIDFIGLHFCGPGVYENPGQVLAGLTNLAQTRSLSTHTLRGTLAYDPVAIATRLVDWRYLADLMAYAEAQFPGFRILHLDSDQATSGPVATLSGLLYRTNHYFQQLTARGVAASDIAAQLHFSVAVGADYFETIASIRAFKLLYLNLLAAWEAPLQPAVTAAYFQAKAYTDTLNTNMIRATTMAMSAALAGVHRMTVSPYDTGREAQATHSRAFGRRIARNVQHLLKLESRLDQPIDPAAGSYYIEKRSLQLAAEVWSNFQKSTHDHLSSNNGL